MFQHRTFWFSRNRFLAAALILAICLSLIGANWGRVECWNCDNMAFKEIKPNGLPYDYLKPPLHTYLNYILVMKPAEAIRSILGAEHNFQYQIQLYGVRFLTLALFCGAITLIYRLTQSLCGTRSAIVLALLTATSAGLIKFNHFGTADSPLLFWMIVAFSFAIKAAQSGRIRDSVIAGVLTGLATADKYNGLCVAIAIPVALMSFRGWKACFGKQCWVGALTVPLGFVLGTPGAIFDTKNFVQDFLYNLYTTPVYDGNTSGVGYWDFLKYFPQLIGGPASILIITGYLGSLLLLARKRLTQNEMALLVSAGSVFLYYYITIGRFPRMEDRFVLPAVPFVLLMAAPGLERIHWERIIPAATLSLILVYNIFCSVEVGLLFLSDPKMDAQLFALKNFPCGAIIENSQAPSWNRLPGLCVTVYNMPLSTGRHAWFSKLFGQNPVIKKGVERYDSDNYPIDTFTQAGLEKRHPDFIAFSNGAYQYSADEKARSFYGALGDGQFGYVKIFDRSCKPRVPWTYPGCTSYVSERMIILKRQE